MDDVAARNKEIALAIWGTDLGRTQDPDSQEFRDHFDTYYTQDYWNHASPAGKDRGFENAYYVRKSFQELFEQPRFEIDKVAADGDLVFLEGYFSGIHKLGSTLMGVQSTGAKVGQAQVHILRFRDGKISEHFVVRDDYEMYRDLVPVEADGGIMRSVDTDNYHEGLTEHEAARTAEASK